MEHLRTAQLVIPGPRTVYKHVAVVLAAYAQMMQWCIFMRFSCLHMDNHRAVVSDACFAFLEWCLASCMCMPGCTNIQCSLVSYAYAWVVPTCQVVNDMQGDFT